MSGHGLMPWSSVREGDYFILKVAYCFFLYNCFAKISSLLHVISDQYSPARLEQAKLWVTPSELSNSFLSSGSHCPKVWSCNTKSKERNTKN